MDQRLGGSIPLHFGLLPKDIPTRDRQEPPAFPYPMTEDTLMLGGVIVDSCRLDAERETPWWLPGAGRPGVTISPWAGRDEDDLEDDDEEEEDDDEEDLEELEEDFDDDDFDDDDFDDDDDDDFDDLDDEFEDDLDEDLDDDDEDEDDEEVDGAE